MIWLLIVTVGGVADFAALQPSEAACDASAAEVLADAPEIWPSGAEISIWCAEVDLGDFGGAGDAGGFGGDDRGGDGLGAGAALARPSGGAGRAGRGAGRRHRLGAVHPARGGAGGADRPRPVPADGWSGRWSLGRMVHGAGLMLILAAGWALNAHIVHGWAAQIWSIAGAR